MCSLWFYSCKEFEAFSWQLATKEGEAERDKKKMKRGAYVFHNCYPGEILYVVFFDLSPV